MIASSRCPGFQSSHRLWRECALVDAGIVKVEADARIIESLAVDRARAAKIVAIVRRGRGIETELDPA